MFLRSISCSNRMLMPALCCGAAGRISSAISPISGLQCAEKLFAADSAANLVWSLFAAFLVLYCAEFMPKLLCSARPLRRSLLLAGPYRIISVVLSPLTVIAMKLTDIFMPDKEAKYSLTTSDLMRILEDRKDGVCLSDIESALITKILILRVKGKKMTPEAILSALKDVD